VQKFLYNVALAERPLLLLGVLLILMGVQLLSLGLVAEVVARTYHEAQNKPPYYVRSWLRQGKEHSVLPAFPPFPSQAQESDLQQVINREDT